MTVFGDGGIRGTLTQSDGRPHTGERNLPCRHLDPGLLGSGRCEGVNSCCPHRLWSLVMAGSCRRPRGSVPDSTDTSSHRPLPVHTLFLTHAGVLTLLNIGLCSHLRRAFARVTSWFWNDLPWDTSMALSSTHLVFALMSATPGPRLPAGSPQHPPPSVIYSWSTSPMGTDSSEVGLGSRLSAWCPWRAHPGM